MPTQEKVTAVADLRSRLGGVKTIVLTEYRGLTVQQLSELRKQLRAVSAFVSFFKQIRARPASWNRSKLSIRKSRIAGL